MFLDHRLPSWIRSNYYYDSLGALFYGVFYGLVISFFPFIAKRIGAGDFLLALLTCSPFIGALLTLYWGHHSSKISRKVSFIVKIKAAARIFLAVFVGLTHLPVFYVVIIVIYWIIEFIADPTYAQTMKEIYPEGQRGKAMGYVRAEMALVAIISTYLGGRLLDLTSYRIVFPLGAGLGAIGLLAFRKVKESSSPENSIVLPSFSETVKVVLGNKRFMLYTLISFLAGAGNLLVLPLYPIYLVSYLNLSNYSIGKLGALFSLTWMISYFFWGEILSRKSPSYTLSLIFILASTVPLFYFIDENFWILAIASSLSGFSAGGWELGRIAFVTGNFPNRQIRVYWGADSSFMGIRGVIFPFAGIGLMYLLGIKIAFIIAFLIMLFSGGLLWFFKDKLELEEDKKLN